MPFFFQFFFLFGGIFPVLHIAKRQSHLFILAGIYALFLAYCLFNLYEQTSGLGHELGRGILALNVIYAAAGVVSCLLTQYQRNRKVAKKVRFITALAIFAVAFGGIQLYAKIL